MEGLTDAGMISISEALRTPDAHRPLQTLAVGSNGLTDVAAASLAESLRNHCFKLERLYVETNAGITDVGGHDIANAVGDYLLSKHGSLREFSLTGTSLSNRAGVAFGDAIAVSKTLTSLRLGDNRIGNAGAMQIAKGLRGNTILKVLDLAGNGIHDRGAMALADGLARNTTLEVLNLQRNCIMDDGGRHLVDTVWALAQNRTAVSGGMGGMGGMDESDRGGDRTPMRRAPGSSTLGSMVSHHGGVRLVDGSNVGAQLRHASVSSRTSIVPSVPGVPGAHNTITGDITGDASQAAPVQTVGLRVLDLRGNPVGCVVLAALEQALLSLKHGGAMPSVLDIWSSSPPSTPANMFGDFRGSIGSATGAGGRGRSAPGGPGLPSPLQGASRGSGGRALLSSRGGATPSRMGSPGRVGSPGRTPSRSQSRSQSRGHSRQGRSRGGPTGPGAAAGVGTPDDKYSRASSPLLVVVDEKRTRAAGVYRGKKIAVRQMAKGGAKSSSDMLPSLGPVSMPDMSPRGGAMNERREGCGG